MDGGKVLLTKLRNGEGDIYSAFKEYLNPGFNFYSEDTVEYRWVRSTTIGYTKFLNKAIELFVYRLEVKDKRFRHGEEWFKTYKLCLCCLDAMDSCINWNCSDSFPGRYANLAVKLHTWGFYKYAQEEAQKLLRILKQKLTPNVPSKLLPTYRERDVEGRLVIASMVNTFVKSVSLGGICNQTMLSDLWKILEEANPWLRRLSKDEYHKTVSGLSISFRELSLFLLQGEQFEIHSVETFLTVAFKELADSSSYDDRNKLAQTICCSLFVNRSKFLAKDSAILRHVLTSMCDKLKVAEMDGFLKLICEFCMTIGHATKHSHKAILNVFEGIAKVKKKSVRVIMGLFGVLLSSDDARCSTGQLLHHRQHDILVVEKVLNSVVAKCSGDDESDFYRYLSAMRFVCFHLKSDVQVKGTAIHARDHAYFRALFRVCYCICKTEMKGVNKRRIGQELLKKLKTFGIDTLRRDEAETMEAIVKVILLNPLTIDESSCAMKCNELIEEARTSRIPGSKYLTKSIAILSEAIFIMEVSQKTLTSNERLCHMLASLYLLRGRFSQEADPSSMQYIDDAHSALKLLKSQDSSICTNGTSMAPKVLTELVIVADLLSLKGCANLHSEFCIQMFTLLTRTKIIPEKIQMLWQSKRLGYATCPSISDVLISTLASGSQLLEVSRCLLEDMKMLPSVENIKMSLQNINNLNLQPNVQKFFTASILYDLADVMMRSGQLAQASASAEVSFDYNSQLLEEYFKLSVFHLQQPIRDEMGAIIFKSSKRVRGISLSGSWYQDATADDDYILTPWNVLKSFLESSLQWASILESIGNETRARDISMIAKAICSKLCLPIFSVSFSSLLGKIYHKQGLCNEAENELKAAEQNLANNRSFITEKCRLFLEVRIDQELGDLSLRRSSRDTSAAEKIYNAALQKLEMKCWKNCVGYQGSDMVLCDKLANAVENLPDNIFNMSSSQAMKRTNDNVKNVVDCGCMDLCLFNEAKCWHCLHLEGDKLKSLKNMMNMKLELIRRGLLLGLYSRLGKCCQMRDEFQEVQHIFLKCISVLISKSICDIKDIPVESMLNLIGRHVVIDALQVEQASLIYEMCWSFLNTFATSSSSNCRPWQIRRNDIIWWLKLAFICSSQVPVLLEKISKLLVVLTTVQEVSPCLSSNKLTQSQWASFFHQASINSHTCQDLISLYEKQSVQNFLDAKGYITGPIFSKTMDLVPDSLESIESFIMKFFANLPHTVICVSMLDDAYANFFCKPAHSFPAWIVVSRLNQDRSISIILELDSIGSPSRSVEVSEGLNEYITNIAPDFRRFLEGVKELFQMDMRRGPLWTTAKGLLDENLEKFLRDMEASWLGSWRFIFSSQQRQLGVDVSQIDQLKKKDELKDVDENFLKFVLLHGRKEEPLQEFSKKTCYLAGGYKVHEKHIQEVLKTLGDIQEETFCVKQPLIFVLDINAQVFPWENIPFLCHDEIYRLPTMAHIKYLYERNEKPPMIIASNAYYLVNPSNDLSQLKGLSELFEKLKLEGMIGTPPSKQEMGAAVRDHDLFWYFGHDDGIKYMPDEIFIKHDKLAAAFLMGCSSGRINVVGPYAPSGAPILYLQTGSPSVVSSLWSLGTRETVDFVTPILLQCYDENNDSHHRVASLVGQNRNSCLRYFTGASMVCYGVPSSIKRIP